MCLVMTLSSFYKFLHRLVTRLNLFFLLLRNQPNPVCQRVPLLWACLEVVEYFLRITFRNSPNNYLTLYQNKRVRVWRLTCYNSPSFQQISDARVEMLY